MYLMQDRMLFYPQPLTEARRLEIGKRFAYVQEIVLQADGHKLHAWHVKGQPGRPLVIYFGGNAEDVSWMIEDARSRVPGVGWLLVSSLAPNARAGSIHV
jgi:hypothetical protein